MTLSEIEQAIAQLQDDEVYQLSAWLQNYINEKWERQIASDLETGKLNNIIARVEADIDEGRVRALKNEIAAIERASIDSALAEMAQDPEYQQEVMLMEAEFSPASWEAWQSEKA